MCLNGWRGRALRISSRIRHTAGWRPRTYHSSRHPPLPLGHLQAILSHPSVKLFVTHGGLNSTYEGAAAGKAMIVMPFFADQPVNAQHVVDKGLGAIVRVTALQRVQLRCWQCM